MRYAIHQSFLFCIFILPLSYEKSGTFEQELEAGKVNNHRTSFRKELSFSGNDKIYGEPSKFWGWPQCRSFLYPVYCRLLNSIHIVLVLLNKVVVSYGATNKVLIAVCLSSSESTSIDRPSQLFDSLGRYRQMVTRTLDLNQQLEVHLSWLVNASVVSMSGKLVLWRKPLIS